MLVTVAKRLVVSGLNTVYYSQPVEVPMLETSFRLATIVLALTGSSTLSVKVDVGNDMFNWTEDGQGALTITAPGLVSKTFQGITSRFARIKYILVVGTNPIAIVDANLNTQPNQPIF